MHKLPNVTEIPINQALSSSSMLSVPVDVLV